MNFHLSQLELQGKMSFSICGHQIYIVCVLSSRNDGEKVEKSEKSVESTTQVPAFPFWNSRMNYSITKFSINLVQKHASFLISCQST